MCGRRFSRQQTGFSQQAAGSTDTADTGAGVSDRLEHGQQVTYETRDAKNKVVDRGIVYRDPAKGAEADQLIWESSMKKESGRLVFRRFTLQWVWSVADTKRTGSQTPGN